MKKYLMTLSVLVITLFVVTGCGEKKLVCTGEEDGMNIENVVKFKDDKVSKLTMKMTMEAPSEEEAKEGKTQMDSVFGSGFSSTEGATYKSDVKGKKLTITISLDINKVDEATRELYLSNDKNSYDEIKADYESDGFKCK